jgi:Sortase domain
MGLTHALTAGNRRGLIAMVVAGVFAVSGVSLIAYAATNQVSATQPPLTVVTSTPTVSAAPTTTSPTPTTSGSTMPPTSQGTPPAAAPETSKAVGGVNAASKPIALSIPAIDVNSPGMMHLGRNAQGSLQVPPPGPDYDKVAWYRESPTPGSMGPAVLVGHIDSKAKGPSVFFRLGDLRPGNLIKITRADKSVVTFKVSDVKRFHKADFPTDLVYGNTDHPALRIITCGGPFDRDSGSYVDNIVVLAALVT